MQENESPEALFSPLEKAKVVLFKNRYLILLLFSALCLSSILLYRWQGKDKERAHFAEKEYAKFVATGEESSLRKLMALVDKDKNLQLKYDALLSQILLEKGLADDAYFFAIRSLEPLAHLSSFHAEYAHATKSMIRLEFEKALKETVELKSKLLNNSELEDKFSSLYSAVLVRAALLEKKLGHPEKELAAWLEVEKNIHSIGKNFQETLGQKGLALEEFISDRKRALKN